MADTSKIVSHMIVVDSNGQRVGTVDKVENGGIKLARFDQADGAHHFIPLGWVAEVEQVVRLDRDADAARREWDAAPLGAGTRDAM